MRNFRSYARLELQLRDGLVLVVGPNGVGKTNLLESIHVAGQGFSPRTRSDGELITFGEEAGRTRISGEHASAAFEADVTLRAREAKRATLNGAPLRTAELLRSALPVLVFTPDRLAVVKGGPGVRRAYFDRALGRATPARSALPAEYAAVLAQRNAALRRAASGLSSRDAIGPWTVRLAAVGAQLDEARTELVSLLEEPFAERAGELGLAAAELQYAGESLDQETLEAGLARDLERGWTSRGPHRADVAIRSGDRDLRVFGSQGEQRIAVLSLLLAEADVMNARRPSPLLLLDDVLSELDPDRRRILADRIRAIGQAVITSTSASALPIEPGQLIEVTPGGARER